MTIDMYIWEQSEPTKSILDYVHHLILHLHPEIDSCIKWKVPYYSKHQAILYMNPLKKTKGVEICFARGRMFEHKHLLDFKKRKVVGGLTASSLETINEEELITLIKEAVVLDAQYPNQTPWKFKRNETFK